MTLWFSLLSSLAHAMTCSITLGAASLRQNQELAPMVADASLSTFRFDWLRPGDAQPRALAATDVPTADSLPLLPLETFMQHGQLVIQSAPNPHLPPRDYRFTAGPHPLSLPPLKGSGGARSSMLFSMDYDLGLDASQLIAVYAAALVVPWAEVISIRVTLDSEASASSEVTRVRRAILSEAKRMAVRGFTPGEIARKLAPATVIALFGQGLFVPVGVPNLSAQIRSKLLPSIASSIETANYLEFWYLFRNPKANVQPVYERLGLSQRE